MYLTEADKDDRAVYNLIPISKSWFEPRYPHEGPKSSLENFARAGTMPDKEAESILQDVYDFLWNQEQDIRNEPKPWTDYYQTNWHQVVSALRPLWDSMGIEDTVVYDAYLDEN